jgi:hypothetical protein
MAMGFTTRAVHFLLILLMTAGCGEASAPPVNVYPPSGRYGVEFAAGLGPGNTVLCSGNLTIDFVLDGADLSGTYGPDGPATFACQEGLSTRIAEGTGPLRNVRYTDDGFRFDLSTSDWHVDATGTGPSGFFGTFRFVIPQEAGDTVVMGTASGFKSRTAP